MNILLASALLILGFIILIKGADYLVEGASDVAKRMHLSDMIIGLTVVSLGTSAPELVVNLDAAWRGENAMILGNIIGSNIYNTCLILGTAGVIYPLTVKRATMRNEFPFAFLVVVLLFFLANDQFLGSPISSLSRIDGAIFFVLFLFFMFYLFRSSKTENMNNKESEETQTKQVSVWLSLIMIIGGIAGLIFGGKLVLDNAVLIAEDFGMSKRVIGLTVIAIGTSLPELATSVVAATKKNSEIAIGNVIGSNILNILLVLGFSAMVSPNVIEYDVASNVDLYFLMLATAMLFIFLFVGTKGKDIALDDGGAQKIYTIDKWQAATLLIMVISYTIYLLV